MIAKETGWYWVSWETLGYLRQHLQFHLLDVAELKSLKLSISLRLCCLSDFKLILLEKFLWLLPQLISLQQPEKTANKCKIFFQLSHKNILYHIRYLVYPCRLLRHCSSKNCIFTLLNKWTLKGNSFSQVENFQQREILLPTFNIQLWALFDQNHEIVLGYRKVDK